MCLRHVLDLDITRYYYLFDVFAAWTLSLQKGKDCCAANTEKSEADLATLGAGLSFCNNTNDDLVKSWKVMCIFEKYNFFGKHYRDSELALLNQDIGHLH